MRQTVTTPLEAIPATVSQTTLAGLHPTAVTRITVRLVRNKALAVIIIEESCA